MDSCAFLNGQLQHLGPTIQTPQAASHRTYNAITNHQAGTANNSYQYRAVIHGAQPPQSTQYNFHNGAYSDGNWQTSASAGPHQVVSTQQTEKWNMNSHCLVAANQPNQSNNASQFAHYSSGGHQGSTMNLTTQTPSNSINNTYFQQQLHVNKRQMVNIQSPSNGRAPQGRYQNANCALMQPIPTTASSLPREQTVYTNTLTSASRHREAAQNQIPRQGNTQNQFPSSVPAPSNAQTVYNYNMSQRTRNSPPQLNKTNLNLAVTQQQVLRHTMPPDSVYKSSSPPAYPTSACSTQQFVSNARATGQNTSSVPSVILEYHNLNSNRSLPLHSGAGKSRTQHTANSALQQNGVPNVPCHPSAGDRSGNIQADDTVCLKSKRLLELLLTSPAQLKTNSTQSYQFQHNSSQMTEKSDMPETVMVNDGSVHMSHGHTGTRAVAVVQPLSQESQIATIDAPLNNPEKGLCPPDVTENKESSHPPENSDQTMSSKAIDRCSSTDGTLLSSSDSGPPKSIQTSDLNVNNAPAVQINAHSEMPGRQTSPEENSVVETPAQIFPLSSLPVTEYTVKQATRLLLLSHLVAQRRSEQSPAAANFFKKILEIYWNNNVDSLLSEIRTGCHRAIVVEAARYCKTHVTPHSVILRQVKHSHQKQLQNFYILKDNDVYSEPSYKSSWLNLNEQLDDIDKEFGFPQTMTFHMRDSESQSYQAATVDAPSSTVSEEPKVLSQAEPELTDLSEEERSSAADASTQPVFPNSSESDMSTDPHYSFKIQVLSPEEAKRVFGQTQSDMPQIIDVVGGLEAASIASVDSEKAEDTDASLSESSPKDRPVCAVEQFCCVTKWMESILGSDSRFTTVCDCKEKQSEEEGTDGNSEKEGEGAQTQIIDLTEDDDRPRSSSDEETKDSTSQLSIILKSESEEWNPSSSDGEVSCQLLDVSVTFSEPEDDMLQLLNCTVTTESGALISRDEQTESTNDEVSLQKSDTEEGCGEAQLESSDAAESPQQNKGQTQKRLRSEDGTTFRNASKKRRLHVDHNSPLDKSRKMADSHTVELTLFGSTQKESLDISRDEIKSPDLSLHSGRERPPRVLSVNVSSSKKKSSDQVHREGYSVKQLIHESWKRSFTPTKHRHRSILKTQTHPDAPSFRVSRKKEKLPVSSQQRVSNRKDRLKKQRSPFSFRHGEKTKKDVVTREETKDHKGSNTKEPNAMAVKSMLKFSVLSESFSFKEESSKQRQSTCPGSDKPALRAHKETNHRSHKTVTKTKGTWYTDERKRHPSFPVPKTTVTFHEFQKKHKERIPSSTDG